MRKLPNVIIYKTNNLNRLAKENGDCIRVSGFNNNSNKNVILRIQKVRSHAKS